MSDSISLKEFDEIFRMLEQLIQGWSDPEQARDGLLYRLANFGQGALKMFDGYCEHIVTLEG
jgi:hypothetical protein